MPFIRIRRGSRIYILSQLIKSEGSFDAPVGFCRISIPIAKVCERWRTLAMGDLYWRHISLDMSSCSMQVRMQAPWVEEKNDVQEVQPILNESESNQPLLVAPTKHVDVGKRSHNSSRSKTDKTDELSFNS